MIWILLVPFLICLPVFLYDYIVSYQGNTNNGNVIAIVILAAIPVINIILLIGVIKSFILYGKY